MTNCFVPAVSRRLEKLPGIVPLATRSLVMSRVAALLLPCMVAASVVAAAGSAPGRAIGIGTSAVVPGTCVSPT